MVVDEKFIKSSRKLIKSSRKPIKSTIGKFDNFDDLNSFASYYDIHYRPMLEELAYGKSKLTDRHKTLLKFLLDDINKVIESNEIESACHGKKKGKKKAVKSSQFNTFSSLFIKNNILVEGEECVIEINQNGKWEFVSLDNTPEGWSTKKQARTFKSEDEARKSALMRRLNNAGYSEEAGNLRIEKR